ncbi:MAG TPA: PAS domain S-box protein, partial [Micropepsaceae bacterium]|nr:PAS domain S-box protein [Micropepsaceae bacterium]
PRGVAAGIAYIPLIFCSLWFDKPKTAFVFAGIATFLTILSLFAKTPTQITTEVFVVNRLIAMSALWLTAVLIYLRRKTEIALTEALQQRAIAQQDLAKREEVFRVTFDAASVGKVQSDPKTGRIIRANRAFAKMLGYEPHELLGRLGSEFTWPEDLELEKAEYQRVLAGEIHSYVREKRYIRKDGTPVWGRVSATIARLPENGQPNIAVSVIEDIDERHKFQAALETAKVDLEAVVKERTAALEQRDLLLREVYHRVKNNLQIIDSLLLMQVSQLSDSIAKAALQSLRSRVYTLGLVHHQLMGSDNLQTFDIAPFLQQLSNNLMQSSAKRNVRMSVSAIPLDVGLDFAIPLGLLVTELVTNSLKHAFSDGPGDIDVKLGRSETGKITLVVSDNGKGRKCGTVIADQPKGGLGSRIIAGLVAQLDGTLSIQTANGTRSEFSVAAPVQP